VFGLADAIEEHADELVAMEPGVAETWRGRLLP
jgi:hypothetical protein